MGVPVSIVESSDRLVVGWEIIWTEVDVEMTVRKKYLARYPNLRTISFDRGYSSKKSREALSSLPVYVHVPKKGKLSKVE